MKLKITLLAFVLTLPVSGALAQTRTYLVHFDGSCMGMTLHITNGLNVVGNSVGCGDTKRAYVGKIEPGDVASIHSTDSATQLVTLNYKVGSARQDLGVDRDAGWQDRGDRQRLLDEARARR